MNIVLLTQDDPFYLAGNIDYLLEILPEEVDVTGCVLFEASPFGGRETMLSKAWRTWKIFGTGFLLRYGMSYLANRMQKEKNVSWVLQKHDIPEIRLRKSVNDPASLEAIRARKPDLLISIAGNQIFRYELIKLAPEGCLNLHSSLLPKYRGLMPSFWVLKNGEEETGVSVFFVDEGIDSGPILVQKKMDIGDLTQEELIRRTKRLGMEAIAEAVRKIRSGSYELKANPDEESSYYRFPTRDDVREFRRNGKRFY